jgi:hypothetical protein
MVCYFIFYLYIYMTEPKLSPEKLYVLYTKLDERYVIFRSKLQRGPGRIRLDEQFGNITKNITRIKILMDNIGKCNVRRLSVGNDNWPETDKQKCFSFIRIKNNIMNVTKVLISAFIIDMKRIGLLNRTAASSATVTSSARRGGRKTKNRKPKNRKTKNRKTKNRKMKNRKTKNRKMKTKKY